MKLIRRSQMLASNRLNLSVISNQLGARFDALAQE